MTLFQNAKMELIPDAGHYMFNVQPELCNEAVREYFGEVNGFINKLWFATDSTDFH